MSNPRVKRPFAGAAADPSQRQITSFFSSRGQSGESPPVESIRGPSLPANVEANLLSVGMRVRKSVPEGYKTVGPSAFKLWTDDTRPSSLGAQQQHPRPQMKKPTPTLSRATSRELTPFCGINSIGGLSEQPASYYEDEEEELPGLDEIPGLTMSQESNESTATDASSRKRFLDDDEEDEDNYEDHARNLGDSVNGRIVAVPRSRVRKATSFQQDQENMAIDNDFDDADFLVHMSD
ncbi:uncharacterized protein J7T54_003060 [Emericellopsis cladophorae]|uniref:Uncharacterized protein n=1 Tax=Emericellopsis cladophorae TaxID=2686198 RepID=A0A9Q0BE70_9HYPO|nr:uncharacterized protein J7T54_003060 [Emericellopsis cladophorae]KAI6780919.1 hypothetical protein J7T54_003060 [Emericellopsis cladophorae]